MQQLIEYRGLQQRSRKELLIEMSKFKEIPLEEVKDVLQVNVRSRDNGEKSFRMRVKTADPDFVSVSIVKKEVPGRWQGAHRHIGYHEVRMVILGWCALATLDSSGNLDLKRFKQGSIIRVKLGMPHNVYISNGGIISTIKYGDGGISEDWTGDPKLDSLCANITEEYLLQVPLQN